jgi:dUTP pyrophosphatase
MAKLLSLPNYGVNYPEPVQITGMGLAHTRLDLVGRAFLAAELHRGETLLVEGLDLPAYHSPFAAGLDLVAAVPEEAPVTLAPGRYAIIPTGIVIALPEGYEAQIRPRSGLAARHGVTVLNAPGTIDADYRGEVGVLLINHGDERFTVRRGERIAQMVIAAVVRGDAIFVPMEEHGLPPYRRSRSDAV